MSRITPAMMMTRPGFMLQTCNTNRRQARNSLKKSADGVPKGKYVRADEDNAAESGVVRRALVTCHEAAGGESGISMEPLRMMFPPRRAVQDSPEKPHCGTPAGPEGSGTQAWSVVSDHPPMG